MNVTAWATELLARHADVLTRADVAAAESLIADGEGWLAAYDLFRDGVADGWLTATDLREAQKLARAKAFSKFSASVERDATEQLAKVVIA